MTKLNNYFHSISLKLGSENRNFKSTTKNVAQSVEKSIKKEVEPQKKSTNLFSATASKSLESKDTKLDTKITKDVKVKDEKTSPSNKQSPKKSQAPAKTAKPQQGKSSIASFFSSKPSTTASTKPEKMVSEATAKIEKVQIKDEPVESASSESKNTQKRPYSNSSGMQENSINIVLLIDKKMTF